MSCAIRSRRLTTLVLILSILLTPSLVRHGTVVAAPAGPRLTGYEVVGEHAVALQVIGEYFTPGGRVYVGVFDRSGSWTDEMRRDVQWPVAVGRNGSFDPAAEPIGTGAFDSIAGQWVSSSATFYGQNGGLDPATNYVAGGAVKAEFAFPCDGTAVVRAFDQSTSVWSNWLDPRPEC